MARPLTEEQFVEGLLAGLVLLGQQRVVTRGDEHHRRFEAVSTELKKLQRKGEPAADQMPHALYPNGVTGRFRELDSALGRLQSGGLLGASNPLYPTVSLNASPHTAEALLSRFYSPAQADLLKRLAKVYLKTPPSSS